MTRQQFRSNHSENDQAKATRAPCVAAILEEVLGCKWSVQLLTLIATGLRRPSELRRACEGLSAKVMNERLRKMQRFNLLQKHVYGDRPPLKVEYQLTPFGLRFAALLSEIQELERLYETSSEHNNISKPKP